MEWRRSKEGVETIGIHLKEGDLIQLINYFSECKTTLKDKNNFSCPKAETLKNSLVNVFNRLHHPHPSKKGLLKIFFLQNKKR